MRLHIVTIIFLAGILSACKSGEKGFSLFSVSEEEKELIADAEFIDAIHEKNNGNLDKSEVLLKEVIKDAQNPAPAHFELAKIYETQKKYTESLEQINKALELNRKNKWFFQFKIDLCKSLGYYNQAMACYDDRQKTFPENTDYDIEFAEFYVHTKQYDKAIALYEKIEKKIGITEDINRSVYLMYMSMNKTEPAAEELKKIIKTFPAKMNYYVMLADIHIQNGRKEEALKLYDEALSIQPDAPYIIAEKAHNEYLEGRHDSAFVLYEKVFASISYKAKDKIDLLRRFTRIGELDEKVYKQTAKFMDIAATANPYSPSINTVAGEYYFRDQQYGKAEQYYKAVIDIKPNSFLIWKQLLMTNYNRNKFDSMLENAKAGLELFPTQPELYFYHGLASVQLKNYQEGIDKLEEGQELVIQNQPLKNQFMSTLADAYHAIGNHEESDKYFDLTLEHEPNNFYVLNNYAYYLSERKEKLEQAKEMSAKSNELNPDESSFQDTYGWILFQLGEYESALEWLKKSEKNGGSSSGVINEHIGDVYSKLNNTKRALEYWKKAQKLEGASEKLLDKIKLKKYVE